MGVADREGSGLGVSACVCEKRNSIIFLKYITEVSKHFVKEQNMDLRCSKYKIPRSPILVASNSRSVLPLQRTITFAFIASLDLVFIRND